MINISNLDKSFGGRMLFDNASFKLNSRERIGLVGRNGHGKSTLLRIIMGEESADAGTISIPKGYSIGWLKQHLAFSKDNIVDEVSQVLPEMEQGESWQAERILSGLGFADKDFNKPASNFSGGFQIRINIAKALLARPNLLLLDEPNNYLDITSIRWLADFLSRWTDELIIITHDRSFMDRVITHTLAIYRQNFRKVAGKTEKLYDQLAQEEEIYEKTRLNDEKKRKDMEVFISRFRAKARLAGMVQSRIKTLNKLEKKNKLSQEKDLEFSFNYLPFQARYALNTLNISFGYEKGHDLIHDLTFSLLAGERVCIIGQNGKGKTTLLKILAGSIPSNTGKIDYHPALQVGYYEQTNSSKLQDSLTVFDEIVKNVPNQDAQQARNICGAMMFGGDDALKKISVLSGGERCRVMLGQIIASQVNVLILDEPTNHLDMSSCDSLLQALHEFPGAILMVTHNELFLNSLSDRLIVFQGDKPFVCPGNYSYFLEKYGWDNDGQNSKPGKQRQEISVTANFGKNVPSPNTINSTKKGLRKKKSIIINQRSSELSPINQQIATAEKAIIASEAQQAAINVKLSDPQTSVDGNQVVTLSRQLSEINASIDELYEKLEKLSQQKEVITAKYEQQLASAPHTD